MKNKSTQGFTLIELLVVISIISLLSTIVLASVNIARNRARVAAGLIFSTSLHRALGADAVGEWNFDALDGSSVLDNSGLNNNGVAYSASLSSDTPNNSGSSLSLNGSNYVEVPNSPNYNFGTGDYAYNFWVKFSSVTSLNTYFENGSWGGNTLLFRQENANVVMVYINTQYAYSYSFSPEAGKWYNLALTRENGVMKLYVDGARLGANQAETSNIAPSQVLRIGSSVHASGQTFNGLIDSFRIYSRSLNSAEIEKLYALGHQND
ncbi:MAG: LamG-like jellyroll fold domain-containing protein [Patescibacteria group bacterium]